MVGLCNRTISASVNRRIGNMIEPEWYNWWCPECEATWESLNPYSFKEWCENCGTGEEPVPDEIDR